MRRRDAAMQLKESLMPADQDELPEGVQKRLSGDLHSVRCVYPTHPRRLSERLLV
jgi:hypothetical protein